MQRVGNIPGSRSLERYLPQNPSLQLVAEPEIISVHEHTPLTLGEDAFEETIQASLRKWELIPEDVREELWPEIMIELLKDNPVIILRLLEGNYLKSGSSNQIVEDSMTMLLSHLRHDEERYEPDYIIQLSTSIQTMMRRQNIRISQLSIHTMVSRLPVEDIKQFYATLAELNHYMSKTTLMHFGSRLAKERQTDMAFKILQILRSLNCDFNSPPILSICTSILQRSNRDPNAQTTVSDMFEFMAASGLTPNIITYTVLMENLLFADDTDAGWQIKDILDENRTKADSHFYSILLNDSKVRRDWADVRRVMDMVKEKDITSSHIAADVLHSMFFVAQEEKFSYPVRSGMRKHLLKPFDRMLPVYCQYFRLKELAQLIPDFEHDYPQKIEVLDRDASMPELMEADAAVLTIMLTAYLSDITSPQAAGHFYDRFRDEVLWGKLPSEFLKTTHFWCVVLSTFSRFPDLLPDCAKLLGDMLSTDESTPANCRPPRPDTHVWAILCKIYTRAGQYRAAEKVLDMMTQRGVLPNQAVWNTLARGYAFAQNEVMVVDVIRRMKEAGFEPDEYTRNALHAIHDHHKLVAAMKKAEGLDAIAVQDKQSHLPYNLLGIKKQSAEDVSSEKLFEDEDDEDEEEEEEQEVGGEPQDAELVKKLQEMRRWRPVGGRR